MKKIVIGLLFICFYQLNYGQTKQNSTGTYFTTKESFFDRTLKPYHYQLTLDTLDQSLGKITFWRAEPLFDPVQKVNWTPNITFRLYPIADKEKCTVTALQTKANSTCEIPNIGGDIFTLGNFILLNTSPCVECSKGGKTDFCRNIVNHLLGYITDTNSTDIRYIFDQLPIKSGKFTRKIN